MMDQQLIDPAGESGVHGLGITPAVYKYQRFLPSDNPGESTGPCGFLLLNYEGKSLRLRGCRDTDQHLPMPAPGQPGKDLFGISYRGRKADPLDLSP